MGSLRPRQGRPDARSAVVARWVGAAQESEADAAMPAELWQALAAHRATSPYIASDDFVFATATGRPIDGGNMLKWWKDAAKAAKVTRRVWLHQLRHTAGTRAAEMGLSSLEVAAILGHAQASTSERYVHLARGVDLDRAERIATATLGQAQEVTI